MVSCRMGQPSAPGLCSAASSAEHLPPRQGCKAGDAIIAIDGAPMSTGSLSMVAQVRERTVGDKVTLKIVRDGQTKDINVTLISKPTTNQ